MSPPTITAALGPTNTGKTHHAIERMLEHASGMIGLPLRLLAREVYDRVSTAVGENAVALITGEEKRVPQRPRYWICTVEAMPIDVSVEFLAVDEIQLAADRERGHVFTDRLLNARGTRETWFMGSDTMRPLLQRFIPEVQVARRPRLSTLRYAGAHGVGKLPRRSAVVAFSLDRVYSIASRIRDRHGGVAVVLGALSPRTRNAQVALYQSGEVRYLVATDAIGMGLNMDIDHVAFADVRKFDGRGSRPLWPAELAQIAGRAGRHQSDGTFGTLRGAAQLDDRAVRAIESHRFPAVRRLVWRNHELDFESIETLIASLQVRPSSDELSLVHRADDYEALLALSRRPEVRALAQTATEVRALWEVCQVPDFRQLLAGEHERLLAELFCVLQSNGRIPADWFEQRLRRMDNVTGDLDSLTTRIAYVRTWSYVAHKSDWTHDPPSWRQRAAQLEDRLSDALHERLVDRFVDRKPSVATVEMPSAIDHPFSKLLELRQAMTPPEVPQASVYDLVIDAEHDDFGLTADGEITHPACRGAIGQLLGGADLLRPRVRLALPNDLGAGVKARVDRRVQAFVQDVVTDCLGGVPMLARETASGAVRGLAYQLGQSLGSFPSAAAKPLVDSLAGDDRAALEAVGVKLGRRFVYLSSALRGARIERRLALAGCFFGLATMDVPVGNVSFLPVDKGTPEPFWNAVGYTRVGPRCCRIDILERTLDELSQLGSQLPLLLPGEILARSGWRRREVPAMMRALGYRQTPEGYSAVGRRRRRRRRR